MPLVHSEAAEVDFTPMRVFKKNVNLNSVKLFKMRYPTIWPQFYTASIQQKFHLLKEDNYKDIIVSSLKYLVDDNRIELNAFVIMSNHIHLIWQPLDQFTLTDIQSSFMRHTAKEILKKLAVDDLITLEKLEVNNSNRKYQVWKREPLSVELFSESTFLQKLEYIHNNPFVADLVTAPENYKYSSALFYEEGVDIFEMLTHYSGN
jgi:REP element-mobilizing transposase RayT